MKRAYTFLVPAGLVCFIVLLAGFGNNDLKNSSGAPAGYTNSPADAKNCSHCMGGSAVPVTGWITSDVPVTGYLPGGQYTITVTATGAGRKGFQVSPQDPAGNLIGMLTAGTGNKLVGSGKYVTHTAAVNSDPATWSFTWKAPEQGAGEVVFYGSIAVGKLNTKTTTMTISQSTVGIPAQTRELFSVFPNPARETIRIKVVPPVSGPVHATLLDAMGRFVQDLGEASPAAGEESTFTLGQPAGMYFLKLSSVRGDEVKKLVIVR